MDQELEAAYKQMAQDEEREAEALEWAEATVGDVGAEARCWPRLSKRGSGDAQRQTKQGHGRPTYYGE